MSTRYFIIGRPSSGKSALAERLAEDFAGPHTYVATLQKCDETKKKIFLHRQRRKSFWVTKELLTGSSSDIETLRALTCSPGTILLDGLMALVLNFWRSQELIGSGMDFQRSIISLFQMSKANWIIVDVLPAYQGEISHLLEHIRRPLCACSGIKIISVFR